MPEETNWQKGGDEAMDAEKELWNAMRQYITQSIESIKQDVKRLNSVRRELDEIKKK